MLYFVNKIVITFLIMIKKVSSKAKESRRTRIKRQNQNNCNKKKMEYM